MANEPRDLLVGRFHGSNVRETWPWVHVSPSAHLAQAGWKLHLTSVPARYLELLSTIIPVLAREAVPFKFARDVDALSALNAGRLGVIQVGKAVTVYPQDDAQLARLAEALVQATASFTGPSVVTDVHLGAVVYARFGTFVARRRRDRMGRIVFERKGDAPFPAEYEVPFDSERNPLPSDLQGLAGSSLRKHTSRIFNSRYLPIQIISGRPRGGIVLALDLASSNKPVVLKEARAHVEEDVLGNDARARLRHEYSILDRLQERSSAAVKSHEIFQAGPNLFMVMEHIDGRPLTAACRHASRAEVADLLKQVIAAVGELHEVGLIHRDLKPDNILVERRTRRVRLIDFGCASAAGEKLLIAQGGTPGYMAPEQARGERASADDDIYALGAISCEMLVRVDPLQLAANPRRRRQKLLEQCGLPTVVASTFADCFESPAERPRLHAVLDAMNFARQHHEVQSYAEPSDLLRRALRGLEHCARDYRGLWLSNSASDIAHGKRRQQLHRSAHRGVAGTLLLRAELAEMNVDLRKVDVEGAVDWLLEHERTPDDQMPGLHFGEAGVALAISECINKGFLSYCETLKLYLSEALNGPLDWPDWTHGAAGQGAAAMRCGSLLASSDLAALSHRCAKYLRDSQLPDGSWGTPAEESGKTLIGFAHGVAGIVYFLAHHAARFGDARSKCAAVSGVQWILRERLEDTHRGIVRWPIHRDSAPLNRWCHGSSGVALALVAMWELTGNEEYLEVAKRSLMPLDPNRDVPFLCCGVAGRLEVLMDLWDATADDRFRDLALQLVPQLESHANELADGSLVWRTASEGLLLEPVADMMVGCGGIVHALARLEYGKPSMLPLGLPRISHGG